MEELTVFLVILQLLKVTGAEIFVKKKNTPPCDFVS